MNGPALMYKIQPLYEYPKQISVSKGMYEVPSIYSTSSGKMIVDEKFDQATEAKGLDKLEQKQEQLIRQLEQLSNKLQSIKEQMTMVSRNTSETNVLTVDQETPSLPVDIVVTLSQNHNLIGLVVISNWIKETYTLSWSSHLHSSVTSKNFKKPNSLFDKLKNINGSRNKQITLTLIWGNQDQPKMMVSPTLQQTALWGEVNMLRYLASFLSSQYCFQDTIQKTEVDYWLDLAHISLQHASDTKERQLILRSLNAHLSKGRSYLVGDRISIADIGMLSAVLKIYTAAKLPAEVSRWLRACYDNAGVAEALDFLEISV